MLNTKDPVGYLHPMAHLAQGLRAVSIDGVSATLTAAETAVAARRAGLEAEQAHSVLDAVQEVARLEPGARILICGSLYLAGTVLAENG